jgi:hypothetical protein
MTLWKALIPAAALLGLLTWVLDREPSEYHKEQARRYTLQTDCERAVLQRLKAPASAEFQPRKEWDMRWIADRKGKPTGDVFIQSWVDAQNSFGAKIRTPFICDVANPSTSAQRIRVTLGGTR